MVALGIIGVAVVGVAVVEQRVIGSVPWPIPEKESHAHM